MIPIRKTYFVLQTTFLKVMAAHTWRGSGARLPGPLTTTWKKAAQQAKTKPQSPGTT